MSKSKSNSGSIMLPQPSILACWVNYVTSVLDKKICPCSESNYVTSVQTFDFRLAQEEHWVLIMHSGKKIELTSTGFVSVPSTIFSRLMRRSFSTTANLYCGKLVPLNLVKSRLSFSVSPVISWIWIQNLLKLNKPNPRRICQSPQCIIYSALAQMISDTNGNTYNTI